jgi:hypothetical protein
MAAMASWRERLAAATARAAAQGALVPLETEVVVLRDGPVEVRPLSLSLFP